MNLLAVIWRAGGQERESDLTGPAGRRAAEDPASLFAIDAAAVREVLPPLPLRPLAGVSAWMRGLASIRGASIPVVDTRHLLGAPAQPPLLCNRIIVMVPPTSWGERSLGLWVDAVLDVRRIDFSAAASHPGFAPAGDGGGPSPRLRPDLLGPLGPTPWGLAQLIQPRELFDDGGWRELSTRLETELP